MTVIPANPSGLPPTESLFYAGWLKGNYREQTVATGGLLGIGGVYTGAWEDVSGYCEFRLVTYSDVGSAVGGVLIQWSYDGVAVHATEAAATAVGLAVYDSGIIAYHYPYIRISYTNGAAAQAASFQMRVIVSPTAVGGGGGGAPIIGIVGQGAPGPVALAWPVELTAPQWSTPSPDPASIAGSLAAAKLDPDRALVTRGRVLTDELEFSDDFYDAGIDRILTGTAAFTLGGTAVVGVGSLFTTEVRVGDYVEYAADHSNPVPVWAQVASITDNTHLTLATAYTGAGGLAALSLVNSWRYLISDALGAINPGNSMWQLQPKQANGSAVQMQRNLTIGGLKGSIPVRHSWYGNISARIANQETGIGINANSGSMEAEWRFSGIDNTIITCHTRSGAGATGLTDTNVALPAGTTAADHLYEILLYMGRTVYLIDGNVIHTDTLHSIYPYWSLRVWASIANTAALGSDTNLNINRVNVEVLDDVKAEVVQPDGAKLHATIDAMPAIGINVDLQGRVESLPAPNPAAVPAALADLVPLAEPDGALRTRARVLTDEGTVSSNFPGVSLYRPIGGTLTLTNGSAAWSRSSAATALREGDYIEIIADHSDTVPVMAQIDVFTPGSGGLAGTLRTTYTGAGGAALAGQVCDWYVYCTANAGDAIAVAGGGATLTLGVTNGSRACLARRLGAGGRKGCAPIWSRFLLTMDQRRANQFIFAGVSSALGSIAVMTQFASMIFDGVVNTQVNISSAYDYTAGLASGELRTIPATPGGTSATLHLYEVCLYEDQVAFWIDGVFQNAWNAGRHEAIIPTPYQEMYLLVQIENAGGAAAGATVLTLGDAHCKSLDIVDARCVQPDAAKLQVTVGGEAGAAMIAVGTYLPGWNGEFYGPTAALVAVTPTLLMASPAGGYYAVTVDPIPAAGERVRTLWSRPIAVAGVGLTGCLFTNGVASATCQNTAAVNVVAGQFVYLTADGAANAALVTLVAIVGPDVVLTLNAAYGGAGGVAGPGSVCGIATATYATVPPISDGTSPVVLGPLAAQDVIIVYADAAYAGGIVGCARAS
jgi:hypothetical protein